MKRKSGFTLLEILIVVVIAVSVAAFALPAYKKMQDRTLAADIRWTLDEPRDGVRTDVVYRNEETCGESSVFDRELERDKKLILEVEE